MFIRHIKSPTISYLQQPITNHYLVWPPRIICYIATLIISSCPSNMTRCLHKDLWPPIVVHLKVMYAFYLHVP